MENVNTEFNRVAQTRAGIARRWYSLGRSLFLIALAFYLLGGILCFGQRERSIPERIEWTWEVRPLHPNPKLPNVLLLGDSITRNYYPVVKKNLSRIANVYLMASSICVGDPRLPKAIVEFARMEDVHFAVIHFNNGMHGWGYTEEQYKAGFPRFLHAIHAIAGKHTTLIWASTTPVRKDAPNGATNARIDRRNSIARAFVTAQGIEIDNQHALMMKHQNLYMDHDRGFIHFNKAGTVIQGHQVANLIRRALEKQKEK